MWRYGIGEPPTKKNKSDFKVMNDKIYDNERRSRKFQPQWLKTFSWLEYDNVRDNMLCKHCRNSNFSEKESVFFKGSNNFKIDSIKAHASSTHHNSVMKIIENSKAAPGSSEASKALMSLHKSQKERLINLFRTAHAITKHSRPFTDFVWQCKLDIMKNVDLGKSHQTDKACREFVKFISKACVLQLKSDISEAKCFSLLCDESTDTAVVEQLIVYVIFCNKGEIYTKFLSIVPLNKADAESIFLVLHNVCSDLMQTTVAPFEKLLCFVADGAATMQGVRKGVGKRLSEEQSEIIRIHCMAHRLELAFKSSLKCFKSYCSVEEFLLKLYKFYHNSPLNRTELKGACESLKIKHLIPTRVGGTRWLPHLHKALNNFFAVFDGIKVQLENCSLTSKTDSATVARGFLKSIMSTELIVPALELSEVVNCLQKVSLMLQNRETTLFHAYNCVTAVIESLNDLKCNREKILQKLGDFQLESMSKRLHKCDENNFADFISRIILELNMRYTDIDEALIGVSKILSLPEWPLKPCHDNFGKVEIRNVITKYENLLLKLNIKISEVEIEWISLKTSIYTYHETPNKLTWKDINSQHHIGHANILALIDILLSIPATSSECERGFRSMGEIKTDWRNKLSSDSLTDLMRVLLDTPEIEHFNPLPAIALWLEGGNRYNIKDVSTAEEEDSD